VNCNDWRAAITALAAGDATIVSPEEVRAHAHGCAACRRYRDALILGSPATAGPSSDLAPAVVRSARRLDRGAVPLALRIGLLGTAAAMLVLHAPELVIGDGHRPAEHAARHAAACPVAFAIALVVVALRPSRARGLLPVKASLAAALVITAAVDISRGVTPILAEVDHLAEIAGATLVWLTARRVSHPPARTVGKVRLATVGR
jgi:predicted anti-sigma-YlaC factor YlaD